VVWRCHVGIDAPDAHTERAWNFLRPHLEPNVDRYVFTRSSYAPAWVPPEHLVVIAPSIDPFTPKNEELEDETIRAILVRVGLLAGREGDTTFLASDGTPSRVDHYADLIRSGPPPPPDAPMLVQVSRWDPMKDMVGVIDAFAEHIDPALGAHLVLAGPAVNAVSDDPEAPQVLHACWDRWRGLPHAVRHRVQLACLPMHDLDENAAIVNALQRHATVVGQKSIAEGFGLTAVEAMLKGRPVVAGAVGGLVDQIDDGVTGVLVDPTDPAAFGQAVERLLRNPDDCERIGQAGRAAAIESYLADTHLGHWLDLIRDLTA
jgi:trehalose synthase